MQQILGDIETEIKHIFRFIGISSKKKTGLFWFLFNYGTKLVLMEVKIDSFMKKINF